MATDCSRQNMAWQPFTAHCAVSKPGQGTSTQDHVPGIKGNDGCQQENVVCGLLELLQCYWNRHALPFNNTVFQPEAPTLK
jgi:hypothetical protein